MASFQNNFKQICVSQVKNTAARSGQKKVFAKKKCRIVVASKKIQVKPSLVSLFYFLVSSCILFGENLIKSMHCHLFLSSKFFIPFMKVEKSMNSLKKFMCEAFLKK